MRSLKLIILLVAFALGFTALADDLLWRAHPNVEQEFKSSDAVIVGMVTNSTNIMDQDGFISGTFYSIRVSETLRGRSSKAVDLYSENSSGRFPMEVGTLYLVFAYEGSFEGATGLHLAINNCGNSGTLEQSKNALAMVRKLEASSNTTQKSEVK